MKKIIIALLIFTSLTAFIYKVNSKPVSNIEVNIKNLNGQTAYSGNTDKKGNFTINIKDKGNFALSISSAEILKGLTKFKKGKSDKKSYIVTLVVKAESNSWTVDTENKVTHKQTTKKNSSIKMEQGILIGDDNQITGWDESMINIVSKGDGKINGRVTFRPGKK